ncbi:thioredoxin-like protein [Lanmaoa asiatica]|nr:thioredoxin-like protein [Lanmaoa asiatica]
MVEPHSLFAHILAQTRQNVELLMAHREISETDGKEILSRLSVNAKRPSEELSVVSLAQQTQRLTMSPAPPKVEARAIWGWSSEDPNDLSFEVGETIEIITETNTDWWTGCNRSGKQGLFPSNYVEKLPPQSLSPILVPEPRKSTASVHSKESIEQRYSSPALPHPPPRAPPQTHYPPPAGYYPPAGPAPGAMNYSYMQPVGPPALQPVPQHAVAKKSTFGGLGQVMAQSAAGGAGFGADAVDAEEIGRLYYRKAGPIHALPPHSLSVPGELYTLPPSQTMSEHDSNQSRRLIKIIVISDYICSFCYIANKSLHDAIEACRDLPIRFDVEFRPFTLVCLSSLHATDASKGFSRSAYLARKFGKEQAEAKWKIASDMAQRAGLKMAEDGVICRSTQAHRLSVKAYQVGGQAMQQHLNSLIFDAGFAKGEDISSDNFLADVAVKVGLMNRGRVCFPTLHSSLLSGILKAIEFLKSTEALDCVEKMIEAARANGVNGVPFIIIDGKWALNGVQPMDCYVQIFRKLAQSYASPALMSLAKPCKDITDPIIAPALSVQ